ncbi:hypothetical protein PMKS-001638 [Pichia membranifaciens]|uniref:CID domain-containing protein n=1 Tax=Pichia membranifaciens TaxID=4926 RepID=A0A1Q2YF58_9ASCO|nr:hypothetical protein PMKS-001638 [Pichia membranifaciens]
MFYLCNDLVQFAKKKEAKYKSYLDDFLQVMPQIIESVASDSANAHLKQKYSRVLDVWRERAVFPNSFIAELQSTLNGSSAVKTAVGTGNGNGTTTIRNGGRREPERREQQDRAFRIRPNANANANANSDNSTTASTTASTTGPPQDSDSHIPSGLVTTVHKYRALDGLHKSYKASYIEFNRLASKLLTEDGGNQAQKTTQLNNLLSSLSSLQNSTPASDAAASGDAAGNGVYESTGTELKRLEDAEKLGLSIEAQSKDIAVLRTDLATELRRLASELDDWVMLDRSKQQQIHKLVGDVRAKKDELTAERDNVAVYHYGADADDAGENVPAYADDDDNDDDSDSDRRKTDSDSDSDKDEDEDEDLHTKRGIADSDADDGDDEMASSSSRKRNKKSVSFANDTETRVFDEDGTIQPSESPEPAADPASSSNDQDLEALLGMLH